MSECGVCKEIVDDFVEGLEFSVMEGAQNGTSASVLEYTGSIFNVLRRQFWG